MQMPEGTSMNVKPKVVLNPYGCHDGLGGQRERKKIEERAENNECKAEKPKSAMVFQQKKSVKFLFRLNPENID